MDERGQGEEAIVYREVAHWGFFFHLLLLALIGLFALVTVGLLIRFTSIGVIFYAGVLVALVFLYVNFFRLVFEITEKTVRFGFGVFVKVIPRDTIQSVELYEMMFGNYTGYAITFGRDGTLAYHTRNGPGIKITADPLSRPYVVGVRNVEKVVRLLKPEGGA